MKYQIDRTAHKSAYIQIYEQLREDILAGEIPRGTKLPSKRLLAGELGVSLVTVEHALDLLVDEGYVEPRERSGYYAGFGGKFSYTVINAVSSFILFHQQFFPL